jgi:hypothetical protein
MGKAGRPTDYKPEYATTQLDAYLATTGREQMHLPKIESYARYLGVARKTLYNWAKAEDEDGSLKYPEFAHALDTILTLQAEQLIDDGIYGGKEVNATIVKLILQNNHGMKERSDHTSDDKPIDTFSDAQIDRIAERIAARGRGDGDTSSKEKSD